MGALAGCQTRAGGPSSRRLPRVAYSGYSSAEFDAAHTAEVRDGLEALGYREDQTIRLERRYSDDSDPERSLRIARELVDLRPDVIIAGSLPNAQPLLILTRTIPIVAVMSKVFGVERLISLGYIQSQARPGGNLTGLIGSTPTLPGKRLDLLHETVPGATRLATLRDSSQPDPYSPYPEWTSHVISLGVSRPEELEDVFAQFQREQAELLAVASGGGRMSAYLDQVADQARRHRLPAIGDGDNFAAGGGLVSYAADFSALFRGAGRLVDKILKGASPADLPVELPATFKLLINQKTAHEFGLAIPPSVLAQATEVLQ